MDGTRDRRGGIGAAVNFTHRIDFVVQRADVIDHQMVFMLAVAQRLAGGDFRKQVNHRRAVQREVVSFHHLFQPVVCFIQQDNDIEGFFFLALAD